jgi:hypothetical protein
MERPIPMRQREQLTEQEAICALNTLFTGWQFLQLLDKIQDTKMYRHRLKQIMKMLMPEIEILVDGMEALYDIDIEAMNNLIEYKKRLGLKLVMMRPEIHAGLDEVLETYFAAPEDVLKRLNINIIRTR